jgi:uncharacterized membrane-anchored protein
MTRARMTVALPLLLLLQLALVAVGVWPQLSARAAGDEVRLRVQPIDPIDPFRGAYVTLSYPDLRRDGAEEARGGQGAMEDGASGAVYISLRQEGDVWVADEWTRDRPGGGPFLRCSDRDWQIECGIESWFLPQDEAKAMEEDIAGGDVVATVKVDGRGNAALVDVSTDSGSAP